MKKVILSFSVLMLSATLFAQESPKVTTPVKGGTSQIMVNKKEKPVSTNWVYNYVVNDKKLKTLFISGEIPADFPKYNHNISHKENKMIAVQWAQKPENYALLNEEGRKMLEEAINQKE